MRETMRAYVINLARDTKKWQNCARQLARHSNWLDAVRLEAADGAVPDPKLVTPLCRHVCTPGTVGCFLSHREAWKRVAQSGRPAVVFEDDFILSDAFAQQFSALLAELPDNADALVFGCHNCGPQSTLFDALLTAAVRPGAGDESATPLLYRPALVTGTYAYLVTPRGAERLLQALPQASYHVDMALTRKLAELRVYAAKTPIVTHDFRDSGLASKAPYSLNALLGFGLFGDRRPVSWLLSEPFVRVLGMVINGWTIFFAAAGYAGLVTPSQALAFCLADWLSLAPLSAGLQVVLVLATALGCAASGRRFA